MSNWYIGRDKQKFGPFSLSQLHQLTTLGLVQSTELVLEEGARQWVAVSSLAQRAEFRGGVPTERTSSHAQLGAGSGSLVLSAEEANLHLAGKQGDKLARLLSTLLDMKRRYHDNSTLVAIIEKNIHDLRAIRAK